MQRDTLVGVSIGTLALLLLLSRIAETLKQRGPNRVERPVLFSAPIK